MAPKQRNVEKKSTREKITYQVKKEIIEKYERGTRVIELARLYNKSSSTICTILRKKEEIMERDVSKGVTKMARNRPRILEYVEKLLLVWMKEKQQAGDSMTENSICKKAKSLYADLISQVPGMSADNEEGFKASRGWFEKFKRRSGIHSAVRSGEAASSEAEAAEAFATQFQEILFSQSCVPKQVFNCNETGLSRKKMPKKTYFIEEEGAMPMEDHLLTCANASGEEHGLELTTSELMDLYCEQQQEVIEESSSAEEEESSSAEEEKEEENKGEESLTSDKIKDIWKHWEIVQNFVEKHHPNKAVAVRAMNLFNDNAMSHFREILKRKRKQVSIDSFLIKVAKKEISDSLVEN